MQFFYDLGIPVVNGYGLTEAGTAITLTISSLFAPTQLASRSREWKFVS